jgi:hypothetical protein
MSRLLALLAAAALLTPLGARADNVKPLQRSYLGCVVGTSSAQCFATSPVHWMRIQNKSATANVACIWAASGTTASLTDVVSFKVPPNQAIIYDAVDVPVGPLYCISDTASTPLYVEGR